MQRFDYFGLARLIIYKGPTMQTDLEYFASLVAKGNTEINSTSERILALLLLEYARNLDSKALSGLCQFAAIAGTDYIKAKKIIQGE